MSVGDEVLILGLEPVDIPQLGHIIGKTGTAVEVCQPVDGMRYAGLVRMPSGNEWYVTDWCLNIAVPTFTTVEEAEAWMEMTHGR